jgi:hypothetical protein
LFLLRANQEDAYPAKSESAESHEVRPWVTL